ncbi:MAG: EamA family transporter [Candidatus Woesearchaeota archaeon]
MSTAWFAPLIVVASSIFSGLSPTFLKKGAKKFTLNPFMLVRKPSLLLMNWGVIAGIAMDILSASMNIVALRFGELSVLYPVNSLTYIWSCVFASAFLKEKMTRIKWIGVLLIVIGVVLVTAGMN